MLRRLRYGYLLEIELDKFSFGYGACEIVIVSEAEIVGSATFRTTSNMSVFDPGEYVMVELRLVPFVITTGVVLLVLSTLHWTMIAPVLRSGLEAVANGVDVDVVVLATT